MAEQDLLSAPRKFLSNALHAVKGDSTQSLVENFTSEMTLVAEGLCEDQAKLRTQLDDLERREDSDRQRITDETETLRADLETDIHDAREIAHKQEKKKRFGMDGLLRSLIILAGIVCGSWVLVTILNMFRP